MLQRILTLLFIALYCKVCGQPYVDNIPKAFNELEPQAIVSTYNSKVAGKKGGHLQGIQSATNAIIITASSSRHSYYIVIKGNGNETKVDYTKTLLTSPYRHAGGCQAAGNVWAVGVEDNIAKNKSKVLLISTDTNAAPITIAERSGAYERSTAGATGLVRLKDGGYLVAVADWNSKNIDFYMSKPNNVAAFDSIANYRADTISTWGSYQSINLLQQADGKLYMIGFCLDAKGSRADLFSVSLEGAAKLQTVASRHFKTTGGVSFRYGAGLHVTEAKKMMLIASTRTLRKGKNHFNAWL